MTALLPDAMIVQTHRDPVDLIGSYCSTYARVESAVAAYLSRVPAGPPK